jgi:hypothetical protein
MQILGEERRYTDKKENQIFLIYKEIQSGAVAKSYIRKGFLIYEKKRKYFPIYEEAFNHIGMTLQLLNSDFLIYKENLIFFLCQCTYIHNFTKKIHCISCGRIMKINAADGRVEPEQNLATLFL